MSRQVVEEYCARVGHHCINDARYVQLMRDGQPAFTRRMMIKMRYSDGVYEVIRSRQIFLGMQPSPGTNATYISSQNNSVYYSFTITEFLL
jgi:hypothetical protein